MLLHVACRGQLKVAPLRNVKHAFSAAQLILCLGKIMGVRTSILEASNSLESSFSGCFPSLIHKIALDVA